MPFVFNPFTGKLDFTNPGSSFDPHSPGPLGDVTPSTGAFTTLSATPGNNATGLTVTGGSITGAGTTPFVSIAGTWNTTGQVNAFDINITDTASGGSSTLLRIRRNGGDVFRIFNDSTAQINGFFTADKLTTFDFQFVNGTFLKSGGDGFIRLTDFTQADFNMLQFGLTTNAAPALKKSSAILQARLADDSAFTSLQCTLRTTANAVAGVVVPTHTVTIEDASGTVYRVPCLV